MNVTCSVISSCVEEGIPSVRCTFSGKCTVMTAACAGDIKINTTMTSVIISIVDSSCVQDGRCDVDITVNIPNDREEIPLMIFNSCGQDSFTITSPQSMSYLLYIQ